jgi:asparagine synthase (glutamine-hydrolysing)
MSGQAFYKSGGSRIAANAMKMLPDLMRRLAYGEELFWSGTFVFDETTKDRLISPAFRRRLQAAANGAGFSSHSVVRNDLDRLLAEEPNADQLERMIYEEFKLRLAELLLMRVDKITMATSVEARVPFLDHKLVEFAMAIPRRFKYRNGQTKHILKRALRGVIPTETLNRKKKGFGTPIKEWMIDGLDGFFEDALLNSSLRQRDLFDYGFVRQILNEHRSGRVNNSLALWCLLNLTLWYEHWFEDAITARAQASTVA